MSESDIACRFAQIAAIFDPSEPLAQQPGLILGDLNTDPTRQAGADASAQAWLDATGGTGWSFATSISEDSPPTYLGLPIVRLDHILVAGLRPSACSAVGLDDAQDFPDLPLWEHRPIQCELYTGAPTPD